VGWTCILSVLDVVIDFIFYHLLCVWRSHQFFLYNNMTRTLLHYATILLHNVFWHNLLCLKIDTFLTYNPSLENIVFSVVYNYFKQNNMYYRANCHFVNKKSQECVVCINWDKIIYKALCLCFLINVSLTVLSQCIDFQYKKYQEIGNSSI
jgi:hypothetical protein